jgi:hypothetical protein
MRAYKLVLTSQKTQCSWIINTSKWFLQGNLSSSLPESLGTHKWTVWTKYSVFIVKPAVTWSNYYILKVCIRSQVCMFINVVLLFHVISYTLCFSMRYTLYSWGKSIIEHCSVTRFLSGICFQRLHWAVTEIVFVVTLIIHVCSGLQPVIENWQGNQILSVIMRPKLFLYLCAGSEF